MSGKRRPTRKFRRMAEMYRRFARGFDGMDFSEEALQEAYQAETFGSAIDRSNGYRQGKMMVDLTVSMWLEDLPDMLLFSEELYEDFPAWFLNKVLPKGWRLSPLAQPEPS